MAKTREEWIEVANAKSAGGAGEVIFVKVLNLTEALVMRHGPSQHTTLHKALRGEKDGVWKILDVLGDADHEGSLGKGDLLR